MMMGGKNMTTGGIDRKDAQLPGMPMLSVTYSIWASPMPYASCLVEFRSSKVLDSLGL